jgi:hypothetical protein
MEVLGELGRVPYTLSMFVSAQDSRLWQPSNGLAAAELQHVQTGWVAE